MDRVSIPYPYRTDTSRARVRVRVLEARNEQVAAKVYLPPFPAHPTRRSQRRSIDHDTIQPMEETKALPPAAGPGAGLLGVLRPGVPAGAGGPDPELFHPGYRI